MALQFCITLYGTIQCLKDLYIKCMQIQSNYEMEFHNAFLIMMMKRESMHIAA